MEHASLSNASPPHQSFANLLDAVDELDEELEDPASEGAPAQEASRSGPVVTPPGGDQHGGERDVVTTTAPSATPPSHGPTTTPTPQHQARNLDETEGSGSAGKGSSNWTVPELLAGFSALCAANREKPESAITWRAEKAEEYFPKFAQDQVNKGMWTPGRNGHPEIEASKKMRCSYPLTGKSKGKSPLYNKFNDVVKIVQNGILPVVSKRLGPDKKPPSGKSWADILAECKQDYWQTYSESRPRYKGKPMPEAWVDHAWECFLYFGPAPGGKAFGDFCFGGMAAIRVGSGGAPALSRNVAREREASRKKQKREDERAAHKAEVDAVIGVSTHVSMPALPHANPTALALSDNNRIWSAVTRMKYGNPAMKARALSILERGMEGDLRAPTTQEGDTSATCPHSTESANDAVNAVVGE